MIQLDPRLSRVFIFALDGCGRCDRALLLTAESASEDGSAALSEALRALAERHERGEQHELGLELTPPLASEILSLTEPSKRGAAARHILLALPLERPWRGLELLYSLLNFSTLAITLGVLAVIHIFVIPVFEKLYVYGPGPGNPLRALVDFAKVALFLGAGLLFLSIAKREMTPVKLPRAYVGVPETLHWLEAARRRVVGPSNFESTSGWSAHEAPPPDASERSALSIRCHRSLRLGMGAPGLGSTRARARAEPTKSEGRAGARSCGGGTECVSEGTPAGDTEAGVSSCRRDRLRGRHPRARRWAIRRAVHATCDDDGGLATMNTDAVLGFLSRAAAEPRPGVLPSHLLGAATDALHQTDVVGTVEVFRPTNPRALVWVTIVGSAACTRGLVAILDCFRPELVLLGLLPLFALAPAISALVLMRTRGTSSIDSRIYRFLSALVARGVEPESALHVAATVKGVSEERLRDALGLARDQPPERHHLIEASSRALADRPSSDRASLLSVVAVAWSTISFWSLYTWSMLGAGLER